jgi:hypothetical protein
MHDCCTIERDRIARAEPLKNRDSEGDDEGDGTTDKLPRKRNDLAEIANAVSQFAGCIASLSVPLFLSLFLITMTHSSLRDINSSRGPAWRGGRCRGQKIA